MDVFSSQYLITPSLEVLVIEMLKECLNILLDWPGNSELVGVCIVSGGSRPVYKMGA